MPTPPPESIHGLAPLDWGGPTARAGFLYQDHVAVGFCVEMLDQGCIRAIWCELHDDITLLWEHDDGGEAVEFVQVKSQRRDSHWSAAEIAAREGGRPGSSILERSLAHDRCDEPTRFRIVTACDVARPLRLLTLDPADPARQPGQADYDALINQLRRRLDGVVSPNGADVAAWAARARWLVAADENAVTARSLRRLARYVYESFDISSPDHAQAIYDAILQRVFDAAVADRTAAAAKKLPAGAIYETVRDRVQELRHPGRASGGRPLREALLATGMTQADAESILQTHRRFIQDRRRPPYLSTVNHDGLAVAVETVLRTLRLQRQAGEITEGPLAFHNRCVAALRELHTDLPSADRPPLAYLEGMMYHLVARSLHSFVGPSGSGASREAA